MNVLETLKKQNPEKASLLEPFEELMNQPDDIFDRKYPSFREEIVKLLNSPEAKKIVTDSIKNTPAIDVQRERDAAAAMLKEIEDDNTLSDNKKDLLKLIFGSCFDVGFDYMENPRDRIEVKVVKMYEDAIVPSYAHSSDAGADICSYVDINIAPGETKLVSTGIKLGIPSGYEVQVRPRSGNSLKTKIRIANAPGTIDSGYIGELGVIIDNIGTETLHIEKGMKIAQALIAPTPMMIFEEVESLESTDRGEGGYGSTDKS